MGRRVLACIAFGLVLSLAASAPAQSFVLEPPGLLRGTATRAPGLCARTTECFVLTLGALSAQVRLQATDQTALARARSTANRPTPTPLSLAADVALRGGRALHLQLTPTPTQCAPLLSLRY
jgi:hypothetical protein